MKDLHSVYLREPHLANDEGHSGDGYINWSAVPARASLSAPHLT